MRWLADQHPEVDSLMKFNVEKGLCQSEFDEDGRCTKFHQSPYDLKILLAGSSTGIVCGCSVNDTRDGLLTLWWQPLRGMTRTECCRARFLFLDITETFMDPELLPGPFPSSEELHQLADARANGADADSESSDTDSVAPPPLPPAPLPRPTLPSTPTTSRACGSYAMR